MPRRDEIFNGPDWVMQVQGGVRTPVLEDNFQNEIVRLANYGGTAAVNEVTITNAATATAPKVAATGGDTNVSLHLDDQGSATVASRATFTSFHSATADTTAGALTVTAAMILGGVVLRDPNGAGRTDTTSTAALLVAAIPNAFVGQTVKCHYINNADAAETITLAAGTGGTLKGQSTQTTIAQNTAKTLIFVLTNVTASSEAYDLYVC